MNSKLALNTITTLAFVQLGKVRGTLMIDLRATNDKLHDRAIRILMTLFPTLTRKDAARELAADDGVLRATVERLEGSCSQGDPT